MYSELVAELRGRDPELAAYLVAVAEKPLRFEGGSANAHSAYNHEHLFGLEAAAARHGWVDTGLRTRFAEAVLDHWQARLKGMAPYQAQGYRLYVYEAMVMTVSVVAETAEGFPYPGLPKHVSHPREVARRYAKESGFDLVSTAPVSPEDILKTVARNNGSISKPTAQALGVQVGELRKWIEWLGLGDQVNALRKRHKRRPAQFRGEEHLPEHSYVIYERRLPAGY